MKRVLTDKQIESLKLGRRKGLKKFRPKGLKYHKHKENPTSFKKGDIPWNKGKKGLQVSKRKGISKGYINTLGYFVYYRNGKEVLAHREIWEKNYGKIPGGKIIHHIDGNKLNNQPLNLKMTTKAEHSIIHNLPEKMRAAKW